MRASCELSYKSGFELRNRSECFLAVASTGEHLCGFRSEILQEQVVIA